jgi:hypothetical protein
MSNQTAGRTVALAVGGAIGVAFLSGVSSVLSGIILQDRDGESRVRDVQQENRALQVEVLHLRNREQPPGPIPDVATGHEVRQVGDLPPSCRQQSNSWTGPIFSRAGSPDFSH